MSTEPLLSPEEESEARRQGAITCPNRPCPSAVTVTLSADGIEISADCDCYRTGGDACLAALEECARPVAEGMF